MHSKVSVRNDLTVFTDVTSFKNFYDPKVCKHSQENPTYCFKFQLYLGLNKFSICLAICLKLRNNRKIFYGHMQREFPLTIIMACITVLV